MQKVTVFVLSRKYFSPLKPTSICLWKCWSRNSIVYCSCLEHLFLLATISFWQTKVCNNLHFCLEFLLCVYQEMWKMFYKRFPEIFNGICTPVTFFTFFHTKEFNFGRQMSVIICTFVQRFFSFLTTTYVKFFQS